MAEARAHCREDPSPTLPKPQASALQARTVRVVPEVWARGGGMRSRQPSWERSCVGRGWRVARLSERPGAHQKRGEEWLDISVHEENRAHGPGTRVAMERTRPKARGCGQILDAAEASDPPATSSFQAK